jgi:hypothetical protein
MIPEHCAVIRFAVADFELAVALRFDLNERLRLESARLHGTESNVGRGTMILLAASATRRRSIRSADCKTVTASATRAISETERVTRGRNVECGDHDV